MKKLSDYKGEDAIELWADLVEPLAVILSDEEVSKAFQNKSILEIAKQILKTHAKESSEILLRIDPSELNGLNVIVRFVDLLNELESNEDVKGFFGFAEQGT